MSKIWFITGASKGFGREWAEAALERGDSVAGTARDLDDVQALVDAYPDTFLPLQLDVTDHAADTAAVKAAHERFGRLDVVVKTPGSDTSEWSKSSPRTRCAPSSRPTSSERCGSPRRLSRSCARRDRGTSSRSPASAASARSPRWGVYHASKWALEGLSQSLAQEVAGFRHPCDPHRARRILDGLVGSSAKRSDEIEAYAEVREQAAKRPSAAEPGAPEATAPRS